MSDKIAETFSSVFKTYPPLHQNDVDFSLPKTAQTTAPTQHYGVLANHDGDGNGNVTKQKV